MPTINAIYDFLNAKAPVSIKMDFDNPGFLVGDGAWETNRVLLALDITDWVVEEAARKGAGCIVSHHPLFFSLKSVSSREPLGARAVRMIENHIAGICMHTNLDAVQGGVNDALALALGLAEIAPLSLDGTAPDGSWYGIGRIGTLPGCGKTGLRDFLPWVKKALRANGLRYHDAGLPVSRVAVCGGAGADYMELAKEKGCDTFVTSDVKYDPFLNARRLGLNVIDADHFCTENVVLPVLEGWLREAFPELEILTSETHAQTAQFFM